LTQHRERSPHLDLILAQLCFASMTVVGKLALGSDGRAGLPANAIVLTRIAGGGVAFWFLARHHAALVASLDARAWIRLAICAVLGVIVNQTFFLNGLARTTATNASVIGTTIPVFTALFAVIAGVERFRWSRAAGIILGMCGILLLVRIDRFSFSDTHVVGNLMILLNAASYALFLVVVRPLAARLPAMMLVALLFSLAIVIALPIGIGDWIELAPRLGWAELAYLVYFIAIPTVGAYALTQRAMQHAEASLVATYIYLQPIIATIGAILLLGERPGWRTFVAAALVGAGLFLSARNPRSISDRRRGTRS
jgi:drug/metabolite transporter (DMT)-like permease